MQTPFAVQYVAFGTSVGDPSRAQRPSHSLSASEGYDMMFDPMSGLLVVIIVKTPRGETRDIGMRKFYPITNIKEMRPLDETAQQEVSKRPSKK